MSEIKKYGRGAVCAVYACNNYKSQKDAKSFFRMPKDVERLKKWIIFCKRKDLDDLYKIQDTNYFYNNYVVCSDHFEVECFRNKDLLSQGLLPGSNPTIQPNTTRKLKRKNRDEMASMCIISPKKTKENKENSPPTTQDQQNEITNLKKLLDEYKKKLCNKTSLLSKYKKRCTKLKMS